VAYRLTNLQEKTTSRLASAKTLIKKWQKNGRPGWTKNEWDNKQLFLHTSEGVSKTRIFRKSSDPYECQTKQGGRIVHKTRRTDSRKG